MPPCCRWPCWALSTLISYQRAKAESLGLRGQGRAHGAGRAHHPAVLRPARSTSLLVPILWVMLVLTVVTAVQRFVKVWNQAQRRRPWCSSARLRAASGASPAAGPLAAADRAPPPPRRLDGSGSRGARVSATRASSTSGWPATRPARPLSPGTCPSRSRRRRGAALGVAFAQAMRQRRPMVARNLTRIDPTSARGAARADDPRHVRLLRPLLDGEFRLPYLSPAEVDAGFVYRRATSRSPRSWRRGEAASSPSRTSAGWEWAGRWIVDRATRSPWSSSRSSHPSCSSGSSTSASRSA